MELEGNLHVARAWLEENGYTIIHHTRSAKFSVYWDQEVLHDNLIAHFIVRKAGKYYAVMVRNHEEMRFSQDQIYRVWFPSLHAFAVHGILELNIHTEHIRPVHFEIISPRFVYWRNITKRSIWFFSGVLCAIMVIYKQ